jgi:ABC-type multidrug transport system permease subunit
MKTIKQSPNVALLFGILAIATGIILLVSVPKWLTWIFAIFWFGTGLLGLYVSFRNQKK